MKWEPLTEATLWDYVNDAFSRMNAEQRKIWEAIKIPPSKWRLDSFGEPGGGFWVVAVIGSSVIWYNDIEEGFNQSSYSEFGKIDEYWCNQDQLERAVQNVINLLKDGYFASGRAGPPQSVT